MWLATDHGRLLNLANVAFFRSDQDSRGWYIEAVFVNGTSLRYAKCASQEHAEARLVALAADLQARQAVLT